MKIEVCLVGWQPRAQHARWMDTMRPPNTPRRTIPSPYMFKIFVSQKRMSIYRAALRISRWGLTMPISELPPALEDLGEKPPTEHSSFGSMPLYARSDVIFPLQL